MLFRILQLVGCIDLHLQLEGLHRRPLQAQRLGTLGTVAGPLHLQAAGEFFRVVLQGDHPAHLSRLRVDHDQAGFDQAGRIGEAAHRTRPPQTSQPCSAVFIFLPSLAEAAA